MYRGTILCTEGQSYGDTMHVQSTNQSYGEKVHVKRTNPTCIGTEDTKDQYYIVYKGPQDACKKDRFVRMETQCAYTMHGIEFSRIKMVWHEVVKIASR